MREAFQGRGFIKRRAYGREEKEMTGGEREVLRGGNSDSDGHTRG